MILLELTDSPATTTQKVTPYHSSYTSLDPLGLRGHENLCRSLKYPDFNRLVNFAKSLPSLDNSFSDLASAPHQNPLHLLNLTDAVVVSVSDIYIARGIDRYPSW